MLILRTYYNTIVLGSNFSLSGFRYLLIIINIDDISLSKYLSELVLFFLLIFLFWSPYDARGLVFLVVLN